MLRRSNDLTGFKLGARDGEIGRVKDLYFDDENWTVRYAVADTNKWLPGRKVLLSPFAFREFRDQDKVLQVDLTQDQIKSSPSIDEHIPISRAYEIQYHQYYNWPFYWQGSALWGPGALPVYPLDQAGVPTPASTPTQLGAEPHLRSMAATHRYRIHAHDGEIGHVDDFIIDDSSWQIRYVVIGTRLWLPGKRVLLAPEWISAVDWQTSEMRVDLNRSSIERAPEYDPEKTIDREYEKQLFDYYRREPYWGHRVAA